MKPLGNGVISVNRLFIAMICYVVLGVLTWTTITDPKIRGGTLLILGLFAVKTLLRNQWECSKVTSTIPIRVVSGLQVLRVIGVSRIGRSTKRRSRSK